MNKTADEVLLNLQSILDETGKVESIGSDRRKEVVNNKMKKILSESSIKLINPMRILLKGSRLLCNPLYTST